jgi:VanZ family protein
MREGLRRWLPVALWIGVVLALGQGSFSADATRSRLEPLLRFLGFAPEAIETTHFLVRKGAHVTEYGVLGVLAERALLEAAPGARAVRAGLLALAVSAADEALQSRLPERTGTPRDVPIDLAGAALGIALARRLRRSTPPSEAG